MPEIVENVSHFVKKTIFVEKMSNGDENPHFISTTPSKAITLLHGSLLKR